MSKVSRRELIAGVGTFALGAAVMQLGGVISKTEAAVDPKKWPWPYEKLDPAKTAELAYNEWYRVFCGASIISSVFSQLAKKVGEPYKSFPVDGFFFLGGGIADWGTVCGTAAGANTVVNLIIGPLVYGLKEGFAIGSNLLDYYANTALPVYVPQKPRIDPSKIVATTSNSPLCHISVGRWMKASGYPMSSAERKDRCARVAGTMAYKTVEYLNAWKDGKTQKNKWNPQEEIGINAQQNCTDCHETNVPTAPTAKVSSVK